MVLMKRHHESYDYLLDLYQRTPARPLDMSKKYLIFSDLHIGAGGRNDDFEPNSKMFQTILEDYLKRGFVLILNGDIEELLRFGLQDIMDRWPGFFELLDGFRDGPGLYKIIGNHDLELQDARDYPYPLYEALKFEYKGEELFIFHGHQTMRRYREYNPAIHYTLKYLANPLNIKNYAVSHSSKKRFTTEKRVYQFSSEQKILSIIGHTHRPLFESMSKTDSIRFEIERLCRKYPKTSEEKRLEVERRINDLRLRLTRVLDRADAYDIRNSLYNANLVVPCMFNSGTVVGKRGMTCLEIKGGKILLRHWFDKHQTNSMLDYYTVPTKPLGDSGIYRAKMKEDSLDYVFSRIRLLGGPELSG
jgi:UDP-2,3-diacylglucosamine pyrophosphatase LpxH